METILRFLPNNEYEANVNANSPSGANFFATMADLASIPSLWQRIGTTLSPTTVGDDISTTGYVNSAAYYLDGNKFADLDTNHNLSIGYNNYTSITSGTDNSAFGYNTLSSITSGNYNLAMGSYSLQSNTTGNYNVAIGDHTLTANTTQTGNIAIGANALKVATAGNNTAIGYASLIRNTTGHDNMAIGYTSMPYVTTGNYNTGIGNSTLYSLTTGDDNVAIGYKAGYSITTASGCIFIGKEAGYNETGSNKLIIGNSPTSKLIEGDFSTDELTINGKLTVTQGQIGSYVIKSADYTITTDDYTIELTTGNTLTLPAGVLGQSFNIINSHSGNITIDGNGSEVIGNVGTALTYTMATGEAFTFRWNGSAWRVW